MWSGPRTISTAMMRSWENRPDCEVWDEPLYPWWLMETGADHPGRDAVLERHAEALDPDAVAASLAAESVAPITYEKHMTHHMLPSFPRDWMVGARHAMLIRRPDRVLASLARRLPDASLEDTGLPQQVALHAWLCDRGFAPPPIIDSDDVLASPEPMLAALCRALDVPFAADMLTWPAGPRPSDGAWADWWYDAVRASTGFGPPSTSDVEVPSSQQSSLDACWSLYHQLADRRIQA